MDLKKLQGQFMSFHFSFPSWILPEKAFSLPYGKFQILATKHKADYILW